jgi:hypothetical protein
MMRLQDVIMVPALIMVLGVLVRSLREALDV